MIERATVDFESRSAISLRNHGAWRYAIDPTTDILCLAYRMPYWSEGRTGVWFPARLGMEMADSDWTDFLELVDWIESGERVEAHNAAFEQALWRNIAVPRYGFPEVPPSSWMCSAAKAAAHSLPRGLDDALAALRLRIRKDAEGSKVMMKMTKPRKPRKAEREAWTAQHGPTPHPVLYFESGALLERLIAYCRQDVLAEEALSHALDDLSDQEQQVYLLDQRINQRGFQLDARAVQFALGAIEKESTRLNGELSTLTGGYAEKATQRIHLLEWLRDHGCDMEDTQKATVESTLDGEDLDPTVARALTILQMLRRSSTAKYQKMSDYMAPDGRVRGCLLYHGASTGRWVSSGPQLQNVPKGSLDKQHPLYGQNALWDHLLAGKPVDDVMVVLQHGLRGAITAAPGRQLFCADYSAIEARVLPWLAGDNETLDVFRSGQDIYCAFGTDLYGRQITKADTVERTLSKIAVLGLGYSLGWQKFISAAASYGLDIDDELAQRVVTTYRTRFWKIKQLWQDMEDAAIEALRTGGVVIKCGRVTWHIEDKFLYMTLPSGRRLAYPFPSMGLRETPWGAKKLALSFMGVNPLTRKWQRQGTYGGCLVENCVAGNTPVLTRCGWVPIARICSRDDVWDGQEWVRHSGVVDKGLQRTIIIDGLLMTPDHQVSTTRGWYAAANASGLDWTSSRRPPYYTFRRASGWALAMGRGVRERTCPYFSRTRFANNPRGLRCLQSITSTCRKISTSCLGRHAYTVYKSTHKIVASLWRSRDSGMRALAVVQTFLERYARVVSSRAYSGSNRQRRELRPGQLPMGDEKRAGCEYQQASPIAAVPADCRSRGDWAAGRIQPILPGPIVRVYDLMNCGPRQQFMTTGGRIVHNCTQAAARDVMAEALLRIEATGIYEPVLSVHDEILAEADAGVGNVKEFEALMAQTPEWAEGLPVSAEGWGPAHRYHK